VESGNDYVIQVKGNYPRLYRFVKSHIENSDPSDIDYTKEKNRGRIEQRECRTYHVEEPLAEYESCKMIIHTKNSGIRKGKTYQEDHYYISNKLIQDASYYNKGVRGHWSIENSCHWVKDVILNEDKSCVKGMSLSENLSILRNIIINVYRLDNQWSIKMAIEKYSNRLNNSLELIHKKHIYNF
jgi:predicted transposase YbfD/YdcC